MRVKNMDVLTLYDFEQIQVMHLQPQYQEKQGGAEVQDMHLEDAYLHYTPCPGGSRYPKCISRSQGNFSTRLESSSSLWENFGCVCVRFVYPNIS